MQAAAPEANETAAVTEAAAPAARFSPVDVAVVAVLIAGLTVGMALWGKWGFLIAFEALKRYCF